MARLTPPSESRPASSPQPPVRLPTPEPVGTPLDLETALQWTVSTNPELVAMRQNLNVSAEAVEVARRLPTSLNPTVSFNPFPWVFRPLPGGGTEPIQSLVNVSVSQPIELGNRTCHRVAIAQAAYNQTRWNILQAELAALVQAFRLYETAAYRRDKLRVAVELADFNNRLLQVLGRQLEANQISASDLVLAEVENQTTAQHVETARQEFADAVADLRQQIGMPREVGWMEPVTPLSLPQLSPQENEDALLQTALACRPEIQSARAQAAGSEAAIALAQADRIPIPSIGPAFEKDQDGISYYGLTLTSQVPVLNAGKTLVRQREAEHRRDLVAFDQVQHKVVLQVKAALIRWNQAQQLVGRTNLLTEPIESYATRMDHLYAAGQTDLVKLFQVRQRLIEAENTRLDAVWQATQAYADLLLALGSTPLLGTLPNSPPGPVPQPGPAPAAPQQ